MELQDEVSLRRKFHHEKTCAANPIYDFDREQSRSGWGFARDVVGNLIRESDVDGSLTLRCKHCGAVAKYRPSK